jgi:hypothetical protein
MASEQRSEEIMSVIISEEVRTWRGTTSTFEAHLKERAFSAAKRARITLIVRNPGLRRRAERELEEEHDRLKRMADDPELYLKDPLYAERFKFDLDDTTRELFRTAWPAYDRITHAIQQTLGRISDMLSRLEQAQRYLTKSKGLLS